MRHALAVNGMASRASLATIRGDYEAGYSLTSRAVTLHRTWLKSANQLSEQDARAARMLELMLVSALVDMSVN